METIGAPAGIPVDDGQELLHEFGYEQAMDRSAGRFASFAVAFAFVSIATGTFTTYGSVLISSGPIGIWTWPIVVVGQLAVALIYGSLAARMPLSGYTYQWMSRLANPVLGWITGWVAFTFLVIVVVAVDYTIASAIAPALFHYNATAGNSWLITGLVMLVQALLVAYSTRWSERINNFSVTVELVGMVALTALLLIVGVIARDLSLHRLWSTGTIPHHGYWSFGTGWHDGPWFLGFLLGAFTIVGFESAANLAEETHDPQRVVPRAMWQAVLASGVLGFLFLLAVTLGAKNPAALAEVEHSDRRHHQDNSWVRDRRHAAGHGRHLDLRLRSRDHDHRCASDLGNVARPAIPGLAAVGPDQCLNWNPAQRNGAVPYRRRIVLAAFAQRTNVLFKLFSAATLLPAILYLVTVLLYAIRRSRLPESREFLARALGDADTGPFARLAAIRDVDLPRCLVQGPVDLTFGVMTG